MVSMKPYYEHAGITIYHGDCREVLPHVSAGVVITDPPYGTGGWRRNGSGNGSDPKASLVQEAWDDGAVEWLLPIPSLVFWPAARTAALLVRANEIGLTKHRCLYMRKLDPKPQVAGRIGWSVEPIWCLSSDGFVLHGGTDWTEASTPRMGRDRDANEHPYQKPVGVMKWLVGKTKADTILDPFCGSGTTLLAAKECGRLAIGIETNERYCEIAANRLAQEVLFPCEATA